MLFMNLSGGEWPFVTALKWEVRPFFRNAFQKPSVLLNQQAWHVDSASKLYSTILNSRWLKNSENMLILCACQSLNTDIVDTREPDKITDEDWNENSGGRPRIDSKPRVSGSLAICSHYEYAHHVAHRKNKYVKGDKVYMQVGRALQGPYIVESIVQMGQYTLCDESGNRVNNGAVVQEKDLTSA